MTPAKKIGDLYFMTGAAVQRVFDSYNTVVIIWAKQTRSIFQPRTLSLPTPSNPTCISAETRQCSVYGGHYVISHHGNGRLNWAKNLCLPILCGEKIWREWVELLKGGGWRYGLGRGLTSAADPRLNAEECLLGGIRRWPAPTRCAGYELSRSSFEFFLPKSSSTKILHPST